MKLEFSRLVPPGVNGRREAGWLLFGLGAALGWSVIRYGLGYWSAIDGLYYHVGASRKLIPDAVMPEFLELIDGTNVLFHFIMGLALLQAVYHYAYHFRDSKSIYLMRRLPDRWELHRRCLAIPVLACILALVLIGAASLSYYLIYILCTPAKCLPV